MSPNFFFVFDVESFGLHGEGFAVGVVVVDREGCEHDRRRFVCDLLKVRGYPSDLEWLRENVPSMTITHKGSREIRDEFWQLWLRWKEDGAIMAADVAWPVEARFLAACIDDDPVNRMWQGPYPLIDISSVIMALGGDPLGIFDRTDDEKPAHDPLRDALQSARLLIEWLNRKSEQ